jgi:hypothetical protein
MQGFGACLSIALQHYKGGFLISQPTERRDGYNSITADYDQPPKAMPHSLVSW